MERRGGTRFAPGRASAVKLAAGPGSLRGTLSDISSTGARIVFRPEDMTQSRALLSDLLRRGSAARLWIEGAERPRRASLVWYGVGRQGESVAGLEFAARARSLPPSRRRTPALAVHGVRHRAGGGDDMAAALGEVFRHLTNGQFSLASTLELLCEKARTLVDAEGVIFWAVESGEFVVRAQSGPLWGRIGMKLPPEGRRFFANFTVLKQMSRNGDQLFVNDLPNSAFARHPWIRRFGIRSAMLVPVFGRETDLGVLVFGHTRSRFAFGAREQAEAEIFASQAALFFEKAQLLRNLQVSTSFLEAMNRIALAFHQRLDVDRVLDVICSESRRLFDVDVATVFLREGEDLVQRAVSGAAPLGCRIPRSEMRMPESRLIDRGEPFFLNDFHDHPVGKNPVIRRYVGQRPPRNVMVIPIRDHAVTLGTLTLADTRGTRPFEANDAERAMLLGVQAAQAIVNARLYERVAQSDRIIRQQDRFRVLGELAGVVAHEIKNALVPLRTLVDLLPERYDDAGFRDWYANTVREEVERMHDLVAQLSRFRGAERQEPEPTDPTALLRGVTELLHAEAVTRGVRLEFHGEALAPIPVVPNELRQVLLNLILNAIQAVRESGRVRVGVRRSEDERGALFWVSDDGPGIPAQELDRIFDPLYTTKPEGSGLGLAVARDLVHAQGGTIHVESQPGAGSTFTVFLPVKALQGDVSQVH